MKHESYYRQLKQRLEATAHGERSPMVKSAAEFLGVVPMTVYRNLEKIGYDSGRKTRSDKGDTEISDDELKVIASLIRQSNRANGKQLMSVKLAIDVAYRSQKIHAMYHEGTVARLLREKQLSSKQMNQPTPHVKLKTEHPNQLWQLDPSICVLYYLKDGESMAVMDKDKFYKNKPNNFYKIANERVFRYVVADHYSGAFYVKYYLARGENQETLFDFLVSAMSEKDKQMNPFEGVPTMLTWDLGTANQSHLIQNFLNQLGVKHTAHVRGNSRAKGLVEKTNDLVECNFESLLHLEKVKITSIDQLNVYCEEWQRYFQSSERYAHTRHKMPRYQAWRHIKPEQLIQCPPVEVCKMLLSEKPEQRQVKGDYNIHFDGRKYNLSGVDNIAIGSKVTVAVNPYAYPNIRVTHINTFGDPVTYDIAPLTQDAIGFDSDAVLADALIGGHHHAAKPTNADNKRLELDEMAYGTRDQNEIDKIRNSKSQPAFGGEMAFLGHLADINEQRANDNLKQMPKKAKPLDIGEPALQKVTPPKAPSLDTVKREEEALPVLEFIKWFVKQHGKIDGMPEQIRNTCPSHIKPSEYESIANQLLNPTKSQLKVV